MDIKIDPNSPQAARFWHHIITEIVKPLPLHVDDIVYVNIKEGSPYFPEFSQRVFVWKRMYKAVPCDGPCTIRREFIKLTPSQQMAEGVKNEHRMREGKLEEILQFAQDRLRGMCELIPTKLNEDGPIDIQLTFKVIDPIKIYKEAEVLGIKILHGKNLNAYYTTIPSEWLENPPRIRWGITEIEFTAARLEAHVCRAAYRVPPGAERNYIDVIEEIDWSAVQDEKKSYNTVYKSIQRINKAVKKKTNKSLFRWTNNAFLRNA